MSPTFVWYSAARQQQYGPVDAAALQALADRGELTAHDRVRPTTEETWSVAARYVRFGSPVPGGPPAAAAGPVGATAAPRRGRGPWGLILGDSAWWWAPMAAGSLGVALASVLIAGGYGGVGEALQMAVPRAAGAFVLPAFVAAFPFWGTKRKSKGPAYRKVFVGCWAVMQVAVLLLFSVAPPAGAADKGAAAAAHAGTAHSVP